MNHGDRDDNNNNDEEDTQRKKKKKKRQRADQEREKQERAKLFSKLAANKLLFAYLLFESFGRQSCATPSTSQREDP